MSIRNGNSPPLEPELSDGSYGNACWLLHSISIGSGWRTLAHILMDLEEREASRPKPPTPVAVVDATDEKETI